MPRIPLGNFGSAIAQSGPLVRVPQGPSAGVEAMQRVSEQLNNYVDEQRRQDEQLTRAKAANAVLDREISVETIGRDIQQEIADGKIKYDEAESIYRERVKSLPAAELKNLDPVTAENFAKGLKRADFKGETFISGVIAKEKTADFRRQADGLLDKLGKQAGLPGADMSAVSANIDGMEEIGRRAYGAAWDKRKQDWKDSAWDAQLNQQAMAARDNVQELNALQKKITEGDYADKLDSNRRNTLVAKLDAYKTSLIQRQEAAAARAQRQQEAAQKRAEAEFNTFLSMYDKGAMIDPVYIDKAMKITAGTLYQDAIVALAKQAKETGGIAMQPISQQQALLDQIDAQIAKNGRNPALDKRREQIEKIASASKRDLSETGIRAGLERGVITDLAPLDISSPEAFAGSVQKRLEQADMVSRWAGKSVSPLAAEEAAAVRNMLDALPPKQKSQAMATLATAVGPRASAAIAEQIGSKKRELELAFAHAGSKTTFGRDVSELILEGAQAIKDKTIKVDNTTITGWRGTIAKQLNGAFPNNKEYEAVVDSAMLVAASIANEQGGASTDIQRAIRLAVGGSIIERNGKKLPIPAGIDESEFDKKLRSVSPDSILKQAPGGTVRVGGVSMPASEFATSIPGQELIYAGPGRYAVAVRGRPVVNSENVPIIVEVR